MRQKNNMLGKRDLNKIRRSLPKGWQNQLARETGKSLSTVNKVMLKDRNNNEVVFQAIKLCNLSNEEKTTFKNKLINSYEYN